MPQWQEERNQHYQFLVRPPSKSSSRVEFGGGLREAEKEGFLRLWKQLNLVHGGVRGGGEVFFENWCVLLLHSSGIESGKVGIKEERNFLEKVRIEEQQHTLHRA